MRGSRPLWSLVGALTAIGAPLTAQIERAWAPGERVLISSFDDIAALASGPRLIWVAAEPGIAIWDIGAERWQAPLAPLTGWPDGDAPSALALDPLGDRLWLGTEAGILHAHRIGDDRWERTGFTAGEPILRITPDDRGDGLWVGTPSGWYRVGGDGRSGRFVLRESEIPAAVRRQGEADPVLQAVEGTLGLDERLRRFRLTAAVAAPNRPERYVGTSGGGLVRFDPTSLSIDWLAFGTLSRGVGAVMIAGDRVWFGGDGQGPRDGVARASLDLGEWVRSEAGFEGAPRGYVARIVAAPDGVWFAASDGAFHAGAAAGTERLDWRRITTAEGLPADQTTTVVPVADGAWIGTLRGLARVDATGRAIETLLAGRRVLDLARVGEELWIASDQGLFRTPLAGGGAAVQVEGAPLGITVAVTAAPGGAAVLTPDALHRIADGVWQGGEREPATRLGALLRLATGDDDTIWVAGERGVGSRSADARWRWWHVPQDIIASPVRGLALAGDDLWVATPAGAVRLDTRR